MLIVLIAFTVLLLIGMPVAFAIGISGVLFFLQHPELPVTIPIQLTVTETQNFALLAVPLFILAGNFLNNSGITHEPAQARHRADRTHVRQPRADLDRALDADERRDRLVDRGRGDERAHHRPADAQARLLARLRGRRDLLRLAAGADHPAGHRLHPLRHRRAGLDRPPVRGRHHPGADAVGGARDRDLDHGARARLQAGAREARDAEGDRARLLGRHLGDPVSDHPAARACATASSRRRRSAPSRSSMRSRSASSPTAC